MTAEISEEIIDDVDISELVTLDEQKQWCERMLDGILFKENNINNRITSIQTINNAVQANKHMTTSLGEYLGYHFGRMNATKDVCDNALHNLNSFLSGELDNVDHGARGMYISLWYSIGISSIDEIDECLSDLEQMESDIIEVANKEGNNVILETLH